MDKSVLVIIDVQKEYFTKDRPYYIKGIESSLEKVKQVIKHARLHQWTIIHMRHLQKGDLFGYNSPYSEYIEGFEPQKGEIELTKANYSCYSSSKFSEFMEKNKNASVYIVGYGSTKCCLATIIDGYHKGQNLFFVSDASHAKRSDKFDEASLHEYATDILRSYSTVLKADEVI